MSEWQPIETAPKDGREILLYDGDRVTFGGYLNAQSQGVEPQAEHETFCGWWSVSGSDDVFTHWMPLPEPPK